jgi:hypothetical protein
VSAAPTDPLVLLWETAQRDHGGSRVCVKLLLGLYNGQRFPFDLNELRCLDDRHLDAAMAVILSDASPQMEVHERLNRLLGRRDTGDRFELLAFDWGLKGRCPKETEREIRARLQAAAGVPA